MYLCFKGCGFQSDRGDKHVADSSSFFPKQNLYEATFCMQIVVSVYDRDNNIYNMYTSDFCYLTLRLKDVTYTRW